MLKQGSIRGGSAAGDGRVGQVLVVSEVALALMLLVGASLLLRSLSSLRAVDPGFDARNVLTAEIGIGVQRTLGLDGAEYSRGYLQHWLQREEISERSCQRIFKSADAILRAGRENIEEGL